MKTPIYSGKRWRSRRRAIRGGYTLLELVISSSIGAILVAGLSGSLYIASQSFDRNLAVDDQASAQELLAQMMRDLHQANRFSERTTTAVTFTVPDRTGNGIQETIRYSWGGAAGDPLTYEYNGSAVVVLARSVQNFDLSYLTRSMEAAPVGIVVEEFTEAAVASDASSINVSTPPWTSAGDLLIAAVVTDGNTSSTLVGSGWTVISVADRDNEVTLGVWWKIAGSSEPVSQQFAWTGSEQAYGWITRITGHNPTSPIHAFSEEEGTESSPESPSVNTSANNSLIIRIGGFDNDDITWGQSGLVGHTTLTMNKSGTGNSSCSGGEGTMLQSLPGDSGTSTFQLSESEEYCSVTIAIEPAQ